MITNRDREDQEQRKSRTQQNYYSQLKFMSIKSVMRNKKIIIKKTIPADMFRNPSKANHENSLFNDKVVDGESQKMETLGDSETDKEKGAKSLKKNSATSKGIVTIKFGEHYFYNKSQKQYKNRKRAIPQSVMDEIKKNITFQKQTFAFDRHAIMPFKQTLIVQPYRRNQVMFDMLEKKRSQINPNMSLMKKNRRTSLGLVISSNRTISQFKSVGKHVEVMEKNVRNGRKIVTAIQRKNQKGQEAETTQLTKEQLKQFKQFLPIRKPNTKKDHFVFGMSDKPNTQQNNKIELYRDFLWKINYANGLYITTPEAIEQNYKAYIGVGNNSCMLKSILRRRFWWSIVEDKSQIESCNFVWTQLKVNSFFKVQDKGQLIFHECQGLKGQPVDEYDKAHLKIFNEIDFGSWMRHIQKNKKAQEKLTEQTYLKRMNLFIKKDIRKIVECNDLKIHNHLNQNFYIGNKKALYYNFKKLCQFKGDHVFKYLPLTFHIAKGIDDPSYFQFLKVYEKMQETKKVDRNFRNIWIAKPGQNTNQGNGISVCFGLDDIKLRLRGRQRNNDGKLRTFILQKYLERPLLYKNRKFDIRHYALITCFNGYFRGYWFQQGYIRTSSSQFNLRNSKDIFIHLTNDAVQKRCDQYGKYQKGNKVSYEDFQRYLDSNKFRKKTNFFTKILPKMKSITKMAFQSTYSLLDPERRQNNFELLGLDFMIDENFNPWLIEINTNPCLELSCPLLERIVPNLIEQTFRICVDPFFPPPQTWTNTKKQFFGDNALLENKFELIFDEKTDCYETKELHQRQANIVQYLGNIEEDGDTFEDDGNDKWEIKVET